MLPRMDGLELCREIRRIEPPLVMLPPGDTMDVVFGLEAGADDYGRSRPRCRSSSPGSGAAPADPWRRPEAPAVRSARSDRPAAGRPPATVREILLTRTEFDLS